MKKEPAVRPCEVSMALTLGLVFFKLGQSNDVTG